MFPTLGSPPNPWFRGKQWPTLDDFGERHQREPSLFVRVEVTDKFRGAEVSNAGSTRIADCESCAAGMEALSRNGNWNSLKHIEGSAS